jgi:nucleotide-binding universal stress UspA family protein
MKTILIGYDETQASQRALERAADLAEAFQSRVIVTSVAPVLVTTTRSMGAIDPVDPPEKHEQELAHAQNYLSGRNIKAELKPAIGEPADTIVEIAEDVGATLIVVGTSEPGILERLLAQSVSQSVSRQAHCDVLIVH